VTFNEPEYLRWPRKVYSGPQDDGTCAICLDSFGPQDGQMVVCPCPSDGCRSVFHDSCARRWFLTSSSCPLCRNTFPRLHNLNDCYLQSPALVRALLTSSLEGRGGHPAVLFGASEDIPPHGALPRMLGFIDDEHNAVTGGPMANPPVRLTRPFRTDDLGGGPMEVSEDLATLVTLLALSPPNGPPPQRERSTPPVRERQSTSTARSSFFGSMPRAPTLPRAPRMPRAPSWFRRRPAAPPERERQTEPTE
jgi:hypothetical protein